MMDMLRGLNRLTDMDNPNVCQLKDLAKAIASLAKTEHYTAGHKSGGCACMAHESWGRADASAKAHFEALETAYMRFWKYAAEYKACPTDELKHKVLHYFKEQLCAHDAIAAFVKGNCHVVCPELMEIMKDWAAKKVKPA